VTGVDSSPGAPAPSSPLQAYDRRASPALLSALQGPLSSLLAFRALDPFLRDVQLRREPWGKRSWASLYLGLTSVLDVDERGGRFRLTAHDTHQKRGHFDGAWTQWQTLDELLVFWPDVEEYLDRIQHRIDRKWLDAEGRVHALIANTDASGMTVLNREASHAFTDTPTREARKEVWRVPLELALASADDGSAWWAGVRTVAFGTSPDFVAIDAAGRLLVVEAKPAQALAGIVRGPAQVAFYAAMWAAWLEEYGDADRLEDELAQRAALGLLPPGAPRAIARPVQVVPVLAIGPGQVSAEAWPRLQAVAHAVHGIVGGTQALEVVLLDADGAPFRWEWQLPDVAAPATYPEHVEHVPWAQRAVTAATTWKRDVLGVEQDGTYGKGTPLSYVLPAERAGLNLLPEASGAPAWFAARGRSWHRGTAAGPTNNLVSSQVQCVNALFAMRSDEQRLRAGFGGALDIAAVEPYDDGLIVFEEAGPRDVLGEGTGFGRTLVDAAFRYREPDGRSALALVEWKYTESYFGGSGSHAEKYRSFWLDPDGPLLTAERREGPLSYEDALVEPFYQRVRQQLLAWRLELEGAADVVRVVRVSPAANVAYQRSLPRPTHRAAGSTVEQVWSRMLRRPDRFVHVDGNAFLDPAVTSAVYVQRYGHA